MFGSSLLVPATVACALVFGMMPALLAVLKGPLAQRLQVEESQAAFLVTVLNLALAPLTVIGGVLVDQLRAQEVLIAGSVLLALGGLALAASRTFAQAVAATLLIGAGASCLLAGSCVLMPQAFFPSNAAAALNLGSLFFILGAILAPRLAGGLVRKWGLQHCLLVFALINLCPGIIVALTPWSSGPAATGDPGPALGSATLWLAALVLLLSVPVETTLATWSTRYLVETGHTPQLASTLTGGFWLSFLGARLAAAMLLGNDLFLPNAEPWLLLVLGVVAAIALGNMAGTERGRSAWLGLLVVGASLGPLFPTVLGVVCQRLPDARGTACGIVCAAGTMGSMALSPLLFAWARRGGVRSALRLPMLLALLLAGSALVLAVIPQAR